VKAKWCEQVKTEWQVLLIGEEREDNVVYCDDYFIPKQEVTSASVTNIDCIDKKVIEDKSIVGTIHSHGNMSVFFSTTDEESTNTSLIKNHIVTNNNGDYVGTKAIDLPCGMKRFIDAQITRDLPHIKMAGKVKGIKNIGTRTYVTTYPTYPLGYQGGYTKRDTFCSAGLDDMPYDSTMMGVGKRKKHAFDFEKEVKDDKSVN